MHLVPIWGVDGGSYVTMYVKLEACYNNTVNDLRNNCSPSSNQPHPPAGFILSDPITIEEYSTPQGTVLSPILYNIYVHKMYHLNLKGMLVSYADDTALCVRGGTWQEVFNHIQCDMYLLQKWFDIHNLHLNINKTKILPLCITKPSLPQQSDVSIHDDTCNPSTCQCNSIQLVSSWRYLGVEMDQHLRWDVHINMLVKRLRMLIYSFLLLRNILSFNMLKEVYFALGQSVIEYAICAYGRAGKTSLHKLQVVQNSILKIILKQKRRFPTRRVYELMKVQKVEGIFFRNVCTYVHKNKLVQYSDHTYQLRKKNPILPKMKTNKGQNSIKYLGVKAFEQLPEDIKTEENRTKFKLKLKKWMTTFKPESIM